MNYARPKKLVFCNNKGGVGKTTLCFNMGVEFSKRGFKTALIDLDPQCNLTLQTLGATYYEQTLFSEGSRSIYDVLKPKLDGSGDIDHVIQLQHVRDNLYILPGHVDLTLYENLLLSGYNEATAGNPRGYSDTSAIDRYLNEVGAREGIDIFIIDTSPSLGVLNRVIFLGAEYFVVPMTPDSYSVQGIENLGTVFEQWKRNWNNTAKAAAVSGKTPASHVLRGDALFIGYVINTFNVYAHRRIQRQEEWAQNIPQKVKQFLSEKHGRNGLVEKSWTAPLGEIQDCGQLTAIIQNNNMGISELTPANAPELTRDGGTKEVQEKVAKEMGSLADKILAVLNSY